MKNYLLTLLQHCSEEQFGQDAIEHAILNGALELTYNLETDCHQIFDPRSNCCEAPPSGELSFARAGELGGRTSAGRCRQCGDGALFTTRYDQFVADYQRVCNDHAATLAAVYESSGLLEEILRQVPSRGSVPFLPAPARNERSADEKRLIPPGGASVPASREHVAHQ